MWQNGRNYVSETERDISSDIKKIQGIAIHREKMRVKIDIFQRVIGNGTDILRHDKLITFIKYIHSFFMFLSQIRCYFCLLDDAPAPRYKTRNC